MVTAVPAASRAFFLPGARCDSLSTHPYRPKATRSSRGALPLHHGPFEPRSAPPAHATSNMNAYSPQNEVLHARPCRASTTLSALAQHGDQCLPSLCSSRSAVQGLCRHDQRHEHRYHSLPDRSYMLCWWSATADPPLLNPLAEFSPRLLASSGGPLATSLTSRVIPLARSQFSSSLAALFVVVG